MIRTDLSKEQVNLLFIFGAHRKDGNSRKILEIIKTNPDFPRIKVSSVFLSDKKILFCKSCYQCTTNTECTLNDDVKPIVEMMKQADIIVYVPVIYAFSTNSMFQTFLERAGYGFLRPQERPLRDKLAMVVVVGRRYAHTSVATQIMLNILLNEMVIVGSGFLPLMYGLGDFPGDINLDGEGIESFHKNLSRTIEWHYLKKTRSEI